MSIFKKMLFLASCLALLSGCAGKKGGALRDWMEGEGKPRVLCTTSLIGDLVSEIGGERIKTFTLIQGDLDPHSYELVKGDDEKFSRADLVFYNGLGLEHGASLSSLLRANPKAMAVGERIAETVPSKILKRGEVVDPHVWMDISLWKEGVSPIAEKLAAIDPEGAGEYRARASRLALRMERAHLELKEKLRTVPSEKRYLMTSHDAFRYFTKTYLAEEGESDWQDRFAAPEGLAPDGQLNPVDIRRMIEFLGRKRISVIFPESNVSRDSIRKIASAGSEMGLQVRVCSEPLYGDSASGHTYLEMMSSNGDVIARHLQ